MRLFMCLRFGLLNISTYSKMDLHRCCSGQVLMLSGPLFEGHG